jgi:GR25 family glycosyltransferase involved in LPS biosynthesis
VRVLDRILTLPEIANAIAHKFILQQIQANDEIALVFEDDCVLSEDWERCIEGMEMADVLYLGYNDKCSHTTFGTHALMISPKARDKIIEEADKIKNEVVDKGAFDHILSLLCRREGLLTALPKIEDKERWAVQKKGLVSMITGRAR